MNVRGGGDADVDPAVLSETVTRAAALNTVRVPMLTNVSAHGLRWRSLPHRYGAITRRQHSETFSEIYQINKATKTGFCGPFPGGVGLSGRSDVRTTGRQKGRSLSIS